MATKFVYLSASISSLKALSVVLEIVDWAESELSLDDSSESILISNKYIHLYIDSYITLENNETNDSLNF